MPGNETYDVAIIGGGINGCGIARDAAGRGLSVYLCEQADLASGTSSAATKLIHGGLRYLEPFWPSATSNLPSSRRRLGGRLVIAACQVRPGENDRRSNSTSISVIGGST